MISIKITKEVRQNFNLHIDKPSDGATIVSRTSYSQGVHLAGWCFLDYDLSECHMQLDENEPIPLNKLRPDVKAAFSQRCLSEKCGFSILIFPDTKKIKFLVNRQVFGELIVSPVDKSDEHYAEYLLECEQFSRYLKSPETVEYPASKMDLWLQRSSDFFEQSSGQLIFLNANRFDINSINSFRKKHTIDIYSDFFEKLTSEKIAFTSPLNEKLYACSSSFYVAPFNYMKFENETGDVFFVMQHFSVVDVVFFPTEMVMVFRSTGIDTSIFFKGIIKTLHQIAKSFKKGSFNGVYLTHGRPYHYSYDLAPSLELAHQLDVLRHFPSIYIQQSRAFYSFSAIYPEVNNEQLLSDTSFEAALKTEGFSSISGIQFGHSSKDPLLLSLFERFDSKLVQKAADTQLDEPASILFSSIKGISLWICIASGKRQWLNQEAEISKLARVLVEIYPDITIIFDGWTSPIKATDKDLQEIDQDNKIVDNLRVKLPDNVNVISVVGMDTLHKLKFASKVDYFISDHATGSMLVDRFLKKNGTTHIGNGWNQVDLAHLHYNSTRLRSKDICNEPNSNKVRDNISYSTEGNAVLVATLRHLLINRDSV